MFTDILTKRKKQIKLITKYTEITGNCRECGALLWSGSFCSPFEISACCRNMAIIVSFIQLSGSVSPALPLASEMLTSPTTCQPFCCGFQQIRSICSKNDVMDQNPTEKKSMKLE